MPQMSTMNWLIQFNLFMMCLMFFMIITNFYINKIIKQTPKVNTHLKMLPHKW